MNNLVYQECKDWNIFPHMISSWKYLWECIITSKLNSFEISTQSAQYILNAKNFSGALSLDLSTGQYLLTLQCNYTLLCWQNLGIFSELPNPGSASGGIDWNRKEGLIMKLDGFAHLYSNKFGNYTLKIVKAYLEIY